MNEKLFEDYLFILNYSYDYLAQQDKDSLVSFLNGYFKAKDNKGLTDYLKLYLCHNYQIDMNHNTWEQQVDHYAYIKKSDWFDGFYILLEEILENKQELKPPTGESLPEPTPHKPTGNPAELVHLSDGYTLKLGDFIQLNDLIGNDYKQTKFYDASLRNPSWNLFYPSDKDFKHIYFYLPEDNEMDVSIFGRVRRLFSHTIDKIKSIRIHDNKIIAYTDNFKIDVDEALKQKEFIILNHQNANIKPTNLSSLKERFLHYTMGLMTLDELFDNCTFLSLSIRDKSWRRYERSMSRRWYEIKK